MGAISVGLGAIGLASKVYGNIKGAQANKEEQEQLDKRFAENESFFNNRANKDFLETNAAKGAVEQIRKRYDKNNKLADSKGAATGASAEATIAAKSKNHENYNDGVNKISQKATGNQLHAEYNHRRNLSDLYRQRTALNRNKAQSAANLAQTGSELLGTAASVGGLLKEDEPKDE